MEKMQLLKFRLNLRLATMYCCSYTQRGVSSARITGCAACSPQQEFPIMVFLRETKPN